jgi:tRNA pseudouridine synthase 10
MILDTARSLLDSGPLCDPCLGRPFAERSFGLTNGARGNAVRTAVALADDEPYEAPHPEACWVCEGFCARHEEWAERAAAAFEGIDFSTYQVGTRVPPLIEENDRLLREEAGMDPDAGEPLKSAFNREVGKRFGELTDTEVDFERPDVLALCHLEREEVEVQVNPAFVYGRYEKLERDIPQTEWPCRECGATGKQLGDDGEEPCEHCGGSGYLYDTSVEEETTPHVKEAMDGEEALFHGAGREDVDARMVGTGRPFVVEVKKPRERSPDAADLQERINGASELVRVSELSLASHGMVERVKELDASKTYRAEVEFGDDVTGAELAAACEELEGETVEQRTPNRVDHRRSDLVRERTVYDIGAEAGDARHATIEVHGAGGLYIKELISGDEGRTEPSLAGLLGVEAEVTALDVLAVEGEDEAFADEEYLR